MEESQQTFQRLERLRQLNSQREWVNDNLYRLMYKEDLYILAYERIKSKPGNMTPGTDGKTLDGWSREEIQTIIQEMRTEQFQFKPVKTTYIPKSNGKMRKLGREIIGIGKECFSAFCNFSLNSQPSKTTSFCHPCRSWCPDGGDWRPLGFRIIIFSEFLSSGECRIRRGELVRKHTGC